MHRFRRTLWDDRPPRFLTQPATVAWDTVNFESLDGFRYLLVTAVKPIEDAHSQRCIGFAEHFGMIARPGF
jgi:hypothetical protein